MPRSAPSALTLGLAACAAILTSGCISADTPDSLRHARSGYATSPRSSDVIIADELTMIVATTAYEAVAQLRPALLYGTRPSRASRSNAAALIVFVDGRRQGSIESLHAIPSHLIREIRLMSPVQAASAFGPGYYGSGALVITSR